MPDITSAPPMTRSDLLTVLRQAFGDHKEELTAEAILAAEESALRGTECKDPAGCAMCVKRRAVVAVARFAIAMVET
jgi:hypothetical protein